MIIDSHQHFWQYDPVRDSWITEEMSVIRRDFLPDELAAIYQENGVDGCVAVQADQSLDETRFLLNLSEKYPWIKGVVGWMDLSANDLKEQLEEFAIEHSFKGVRHILQAEPDGFMTSLSFVKGLRELAKKDLTYDILTTERQLVEVEQLVQSLPEMRLVIDHVSKPDIKNHSFDHWAKYMERIAIFEHVHVKLSGMITEADWSAWTIDDLAPYMDFCLEHFGPDRLMFGSDWPVCLVAGSYGQVKNSILQLIKKLSKMEQEAIMGGTASSFYKLN